MSTPVTAIQLTIVETPFTEAYFEMLSELNQDGARNSFQNLGSGDNFRNNASSSTALFINAQGGDDTIFTGSGNDVVHGGSGADLLVSGGGDDKLTGGSGNDTLEGGSGFDQLSGGSGDDDLVGGANADFLEGGTGNDVLLGDHDGSPTSQQGRDTLDGGGGNDILSGGGGADVLVGGFGADTFRFDTHRDLSLGHSDFISDFSRAEGDKIDLRLMDANLNVANNQAFVFSAAPSSQAGTLWLGNVYNGQQEVFMNIDGGAADVSFSVRFDDPAITSLQATDFFL